MKTFLSKNHLKDWPEIFFFTALFIFSSILMWKTFRINSEGNMQIAAKAWSDFSATIPLIRSFSLGSNFPPQYPIFAGPPIRYHFVFFAVVGSLEKTGIPLDWALNGLSTIFFFLLLLLIYNLGKAVFKSKTTGIISIILFLFNGSFGFLEFFKKNPLSIATPEQILRNTDFSSFGPYDGKVVSAFWNLNIYTNQRHLALAYAVFLFFMLMIFKLSKKPEKLTYKKAAGLGFILGIFPFIHLSVFLMFGISLVTFLLIYPKLFRKIITIGVVALTIAIPQYLYMGSTEIKTPLFNPGYLVGELTILNFLKYWFLNLGLTSLLAPVGFLLAKKGQRKLLIPFFFFFIVGNLFQFSPDMPTNHKFFNLFVIGLNFFSAYFLVKIWRRHLLGKVGAVLLLLSLTLTGIIDLPPILNDRYITLEDIPNNKAATFIKKSTPKDSVFLNASFIFDPASIAGRKIYLGWPYFSWGAGYDTAKRDIAMKKILSPQNLQTACTFLISEGIDYIETQSPNNFTDTPVDYEFFEKNFQKIYYDPKTNFSIYNVFPTCLEYDRALKSSHEERR